MKRKLVPLVPPLNQFSLPLAHMLAATAYLPHPEVVREVGRAVFPTSRSSRKRVTAIEASGDIVGMYDDNTTPRWALLWSHGFAGVSKATSKGWTFAHVWPSGEDLESYTHLANLVMIPEAFGSLTDKDGPLTTFLRWHAFTAYDWKPRASVMPTKPAGFDEVKWRYFEPLPSPKQFIRTQFAKAKCKRAMILRPLMLFGTEP